MWLVHCLLCTFTFPEPSTADRAEIAKLIPNFNRAPPTDSGRPWRELDGPYLSQRIQLLTPAFGIVRQGLMWSTGSITLSPPGESTKFLIEKRNGAWRVMR